ncbi:MAG: dihydrodipicolinate synthase family protein [Proteobacteria bacterium]|nr:dihydrodipicolinate synthase family protein [Pseudomonadota bacterium]MBU4470602.1 dihydrodipicolinate synthase family protein [Pseudomonadota bacterium]MCG2753327.1 dihydrodipicolinate synthase family protein [Desulfobacteraceae bacterium]
MGNKTSFKTTKTSEQKQWAREHFVGLEPLLWPIFSPDFKSLDEEGVRNDVRNSIRHGFCSVFCMGLGLTNEEYRKMIQVACDEAKGQIGVGASVSGQPLEGDIEMIEFCEKAGCTYLSIGVSRHPKHRPQTEEEFYQAYLPRMEATKLPVVLYASVVPHQRKFGIDGVPIHVFDRLADLPNVVAVKVSQPVSMTATLQLCERTCDRLIIGPTNLDFVPILAKHYHQQWSGQWNVEAVNSPEKPYGVEMMKLFGQGKYEEAMKIFDIIEPLHSAFFQLQVGYIRQTNHPWGHNKYYQWVVGGNGGLIKNLHYKNDLVQDLDEKEREKIRNLYHSVGIETVTAPEEEFIVGKAAYARGVRAKDLPETPYYK